MSINGSTIAGYIEDVKKLQPEDLLNCINTFEQHWKLDKSKYDPSDSLNLGFEKFFQGETFDDNGFPVKIDLDLLATKHRQKQRVLGEFYHRAVELELAYSASKDINDSEMTVGNRLQRIMYTADDAYEIVFRYSRSRDRIINPTVVPVTPEADTSILFRSTVLDIDGLSSYQELLLFYLEQLYRENLRRYGGKCYKQIKTDNGMATKAWEPYMDIEEFVYSSTPKETKFDQWVKLTSNAGNAKKVIEYLNECKDIQFPDIKKNRNVWSFQNGIMMSGCLQKDGITHINTFVGYESPEFLQLDNDIVAAKYFEHDFEPIGDKNWRDIETPWMQSILDYQEFDKETCEWMYAFAGRLCFDAGDLDDWQVMPFFKGMARSGKGTLICDVFQKFYEQVDVKTIANNIEGQFGLGSIYQGLMFIGPEIKSDFSLDQAQFQSMVSAESVSVSRKYHDTDCVKWKMPGVMAGNELPNWTDNSGSILRRLITFEFAHQVDDDKADPTLKKKLSQEIPAILNKCTLAYLEMVDKYKNVDIWKILPPYFKQIQHQVAAVTNPLRYFLQSDHVCFEEDSAVPLEIFQQHFTNFCTVQCLGRHKFTTDFYRGPFSSKKLKLEKCTRVYDGNHYNNKEFIFGIDIDTSSDAFTIDSSAL